MNNRILKFRVWDVKLNQFLPKTDIHGLCLEKFFGLDFNGELRCLHSVRERDKFVIQQFTGIYDKNKKPIYEGDIVKFQYEVHEHEFEEETGEVFFEDGIFLFSRKLEFCTADCNFKEQTLEIVGNIFETPNLLRA